ncbi:MAG: hypothetical protein H3C35_08495 [Bacteroidetes bacterium]|nr:hypothetical protein [Bacteroidota bacterium]
MKYRGKKYEDSIIALRKIRAQYKITKLQNDKDAYHAEMKRIAKIFSISVKTVYRDMKKKIPGLRKTRSDQGKLKTKLSAATVEKANELMKAGKTKHEAQKILKMSDRKMKRLNNRNKTAQVSDTFRQTEGGQAKVSDTSRFGDKAKEFFKKLFEYDLIAPDKGVGLKHGGTSFVVTKSDLNDVILILTNSYNRKIFADENKLPFDRTRLRHVMTEHLIEEQMRLARESGDYKMVEAITRMNDRLKEDSVLPDDFDTMIKMCRELKADISETDVIALIKKVSE